MKLYSFVLALLFTSSTLAIRLDQHQQLMGDKEPKKDDAKVEAAAAVWKKDAMVDTPSR